MAANHWSGGRPASFQHQGRDCELQWLIIFFMSPVVLISPILTYSTPPYRGILPPRLGNQPANLPRREKGMQPLLCHLRFYHLNVFSLKVIGQICLIWNTCFSFFYSCLFAFVILILDLPYTPHIVSLLCCSILWIYHIWYDISGKSTPHHKYMFW